MSAIARMAAAIRTRENIDFILFIIVAVIIRTSVSQKGIRLFRREHLYHTTDTPSLKQTSLQEGCCSERPVFGCLPQEQHQPMARNALYSPVPHSAIQPGMYRGFSSQPADKQIGRASCRERV